MHTRRSAFSSHLCPRLTLALLCPRLPSSTPTPKITLQRRLLPPPPLHGPWRRAFNTGRRTRSIREGDGDMHIACPTIELPLDELLNAEVDAEVDAEGEEMMGMLRMGEEGVQSSEHEASGESGRGSSEGVGMDPKAEE
ncbi:hypothetical protein B0H13DRAFT_319608 [Mycena leptocephala]|nr:hypothetical protein B0H13DRAFT_319608 [Mycena leptocephala]